jgi:hypothetical protein
VDDPELATTGNGAEASLVRLLGEILSRSPEDEIATQDSEELRKLLAMWFAEIGHTKPLRRNYGRGASGSVLFWDEAHWLIDASKGETPESAVRRLRVFVERNQATFNETVLFWGMHPPTTIQVAEGLVLGPLDALPPSEPRRYFLAESLSDAERRTTEFATHYPKPRAVLARQMSVKPVYEDGMASPQPFSWDDKYFMADLLQVLPLVIRSPVIRVAEWQQWPADTPVFSLGTAYGWSMHARVTRDLPKASYDDSLAKRLVSSYLGLAPRDRNRLRLPLRRLNAALLSESLADKAIELGVALEALLSEPDDPMDGIAHRVALRAALLIGSELATRQVIVKGVKALYELRSNAAHGIDLDEVVRERRPRRLAKKFSDAETISAALNRGQDLICDVASEVLKRGEFPVYHQLELDRP